MRGDGEQPTALEAAALRPEAGLSERDLQVREEAACRLGFVEGQIGSEGR